MSVTKSLNMTQSGRVQNKPKLQKATTAEMILKQRYEETLALKNAAALEDIDEESKKSTERNKKKRSFRGAQSLLLDDSQSGFGHRNG